MEYIELVIKIPKGAYKATCNGCMLPPDVENVVDAIKNGTPLPKGHGALKDTDAILRELSVVSSRPVKGQLYMIRQAQTLVEADKTESPVETL